MCYILMTQCFVQGEPGSPGKRGLPGPAGLGLPGPKVMIQSSIHTHAHMLIFLEIVFVIVKTYITNCIINMKSISSIWSVAFNQNNGEFVHV